ncbi:hypothetical protein J8A87_28690 [Vibrio parahaemolyticus]|uniref:hypothetical protein n=1 Tax=Vibrio TaxID=662 RepID=UPI002964220B|nr:hypothetical protein [Vibrio sp. Vb0587]MBE4779276.1 hypothetical protein [Vibrio parahaemolyticus]MCF9168398.1 hypothetical protein [Vibrio parahaemolyticus]MDG3414363.1 hypothetical protein [Vibrio parahaemolyticus]MDW1964123.1 hypothetical protein [Vibrio sp. Vb0587]
MIIYYKNSERKPSDGDLKIMANGDMFIRGQSYARRNGHIIGAIANSFTWYPFHKEEESFEPHSVSRDREEYKKKGLQIYSTNSKRKKDKHKHLRLNLHLEADRKKYMEIFNCTEISEGIDSVVLSIKC